MRILLVEDESKIAQAIKKGLERESYAVDVVDNGTDGLDYGLSQQYDLIILDRMIPEIDGLTVTKRLRAGAIHTPILILTAKAQVEDKVEGLNTGADDYLVKPFAFTELLARIRALSRRPTQSLEPILYLGDLILNTITHEVKRGVISISLSGKEYALLEYLLRNKNKPVTKDHILNHVWDYDAEVMPNSVEVYIKHLRNKIDKPFPNSDLIKTIRGFGYKLSQT